jgi:hypothetical protein
VPEAVVDPLEPIEIEEEHRVARLGAALRAYDAASEALQE